MLVQPIMVLGLVLGSVFAATLAGRPVDHEGIGLNTLERRQKHQGEGLEDSDEPSRACDYPGDPMR